MHLTYSAEQENIELMTKLVKIDTTKYLDLVAYIKPHPEKSLGGADCYFSKYDNSYITHVGMEDNIKHLAEREITEELTHGVGFSPKDGKWYGWSHRAIYGFKIGSTCKKGDAHFHGATIDEQEEDAIRFWSEEYHLNTRCDGIIETDGDKYFDIKWDYTDGVPNEKLRGKNGGCLHFIEPLGRGEWTAKTMQDAKQMAIDFNRGVS